MNEKVFYETITNKTKKINIEISEEQSNKLYEFMNLLLEWNKKINLTSITDPEEIIVKHFIDSFTISKYIEKDAKVIDVGTGAGFPGIPLKIIRDDLKITLLDSLNKRISFLDEVINKLKLKNIITTHARAEEFGRKKENREKYDIATSRAVANTAVLSEYLMPLVIKNGKSIYMKGPDIDEEIKNGEKAIKVLGGKIEKIEKFTLPETDMKRSIVIIKKVNFNPRNIS